MCSVTTPSLIPLLAPLRRRAASATSRCALVTKVVSRPFGRRPVARAEGGSGTPFSESHHSRILSNDLASL
jgi:hypothetical protein